MNWKIPSIILIAILVAVGFTCAATIALYERDYSGHLDSIEGQLSEMNQTLIRLSQMNQQMSQNLATLSQMNQTLVKLSQMSQNLATLSQINRTLTTLVAQPAYAVISMRQNFSWTNPDTAVGFYDINCSKFSRMFVYLTIDKMNPPTGNTTTFWLSQIIWHLYPSNRQSEWTWSRQDVAPETLSITAYPFDNFNGSTSESQGGAEFTTIGQYADLTFYFNSTAPTGWALLTCSVYLRNE